MSRKPTGRPRGRPRKHEALVTDTPDVTKTPEFQEAVQSAIRAEMARFEAMFANLQPAKAGEAGVTAESMAMALAGLVSQNSGKVYVDPAVLKQRKAARERMLDLIKKAAKDGRKAEYVVRAKTLLANRVVEPKWIDTDHQHKDTEIVWPGIPNEAMAPINDTAREIFAAFKESLGSVEKVVPEDEYAVLSNGLVVKNGAINRSLGAHNRVSAPEVALPETVMGDVEEDGLVVKSKNKPGRYVEKRILGSIAEPAREAI